MKNVSQIIKTRHNNKQRQSIRKQRKKEKKSLVSHGNMKQELGREMQIEQCNFNESMELGWIRLGIWRLRRQRTDAEKQRCPLFNEVENVIYSGTKEERTTCR